MWIPYQVSTSIIKYNTAYSQSEDKKWLGNSLKNLEPWDGVPKGYREETNI